MNKAMSMIAPLLGSAVVLVGVIAFAADDEKTAKDGPTEKTPRSSLSVADEKTAIMEAADQVLSDRKLTKNDRKILLDENASLEKFEKIKPIYADYHNAMTKMAVIVNYDQNLQALQFQAAALREQVAILQVNIAEASRQPNNGIVQSRATQQNPNLSPMRAQETALNSQITQVNSQYNQMQLQGPTGQFRLMTADELEKARKAYVDFVLELEKDVAPLVKTYTELSRDKKLAEAINALKRQTGYNYKLGPSDQLNVAIAAVREVKQLTSAPRPVAKKKAKTKKGA